MASIALGQLRRKTMSEKRKPKIKRHTQVELNAIMDKYGIKREQKDSKPFLMFRKK